MFLTFLTWRGVGPFEKVTTAQPTKESEAIPDGEVSNDMAIDQPSSSSIGLGLVGNAVNEGNKQSVTTANNPDDDTNGEKGEDIKVDVGTTSSNSTRSSTSPLESLESGPSSSVPYEEDKTVVALPPSGFTGNTWVIVLCISMVLSFYVGTETGFGNFISVYAVQRGLMGESDASLLSSVYWGLFLAGRLIGIPLSKMLSSQAIVLGDLLLGLVTLILIIIFQDSVPMLWILTGVLGLVVATIYAACITLLENTVVLNGTILSVCVVFNSCGDAIFPMIMGMAFEWPAGPLSMMYVALGLMSACVLAYFFAYFYRKKHMPAISPDTTIVTTTITAVESPSSEDTTANAYIDEDGMSNGVNGTTETEDKSNHHE